MEILAAPGTGSRSRGRRGVAVVLCVLVMAAVLPVVVDTVVARHSGAAGGCSATPVDGYGQAVCGDSPLGFWRLRDTSGTTASDSSVNHYDATIAQSTSNPLTLGDPGPILGDSASTAFHYPDVRDQCNGVNLPSAAVSATAQTGALSVEVWAQYDSGVWSGLQSLLFANWGRGYTLSGGLPTQSGMGNATVKNGAPTGPYGYDTLWSAGAGAAPFADSGWHQIVTTRIGLGGTGGAWIIYVDGLARGVAPSYPMDYSPATAASIGKNPSAGTSCGGSSCVTCLLGWAGDVAETSVYDHALSADQVATHYQASGRTIPAALLAAELYGGSNPSEGCTSCQGVTSQFTHNPVDASTGNFWHTFDDLAIPGRGPALDLTQTYNSLAAGTNGPLGYGWTHSYQVALSIGAGGSPVTVSQENGSQVTFTGSGSDYTAPPQVDATLAHNGDGTWTFVRQKRSTFKFNSSGQLSSIRDLNGNATSLSYASGQLSTVTDSAGQALTFSYNGSLLSSVSDSASPARQVQFGYDGSGNLTSVTDAGGGVTTMGYDASHHLTSMLDPKQQGSSNPQPLTNIYDPTTSKVTSQTDFAGRTTNFDYTSIPGSTKVTDPKGDVTVEHFIGSQPATITRGYGSLQASTWTYAYDPATSLPTGVIDPNGHLAQMGYDSAGNLTARSDGVDATTPAQNQGRSTTYSYDNLNDLTGITDANGVHTTLTYDSSGNLQSRSTPLVGQSGTNQSTSYAYGDSNHPGDVTSITDPNGKTWSYGYDQYGDLNKVTDPTSGANVTRSCFDTVGNRTETITPKGSAAGVTCSTSNPSYTSLYTYNAFGQPLTSTDANGHQAVNTYDADRNLASAKDANNNQTTYTYDLVSELTQITRPDTSTLKNDYWPDGTLKSQTDGANATTNYTYDTLGHLASVTDPNNRTTGYGYDAVNNLVTKTDPGGNCATTPKAGCATYSYDVTNQRTSVNYSDGLTPGATYGYDKDGQRIAMTDGTGQTTWTWDSLHRIAAQTTGTGGPSPQTTNYGYDLKNQLTTIGYPGTNKTVTRAYDEAGHLTGVTDWSSNTTTFGYDPNSNLTNETVPVGSVSDNFTYNHADQPTGTTVNNGSGQLVNLTYGPDNNGLLTSTSQTGLPGAASNSYGYNTLNQLTQTNNTPTWSYSQADNLTQLAAGTGTNTQAFDAANQLCYSVPTGPTGSCSAPPSGATTFGYDARGNRVQQSPPGASTPTTSGYDQANRLTSTGPQQSTHQGAYSPVAPTRIVDTRNGTGTCSPSPCARVPANSILTVQVGGQGGIPTSGVSAVVLDVTATNTSDTSNVTVYQTGTTKPNAPNVQFYSGSTESNLVVVPPSSNGEITIATASAAVDLTVDVHGFYVDNTSTSGSYYNAVTPTRIMNTDDQTGTCSPSPCNTLQANSPVAVHVTGTGGVPSSGVTAVAVDATAYDPDNGGQLTLWASTDTQPATPNLNFGSHQKAVLAIVKVGSDGNIKINSNVGGGTHVALDIQGWYGNGGSAYHPVTPARVLDTRNGTGTCSPTACARIPAWQSLTVQIAGQGGIPATGANAVTATLSSVNCSGNVTIYPSGTSFPGTPNVYRACGSDFANTVNLKLGNDGKLVITTQNNATDVYLDVTGYYTTAAQVSIYAYNADGLRTQKATPDQTTITSTWTPSDGATGLPQILADKKSTDTNPTYYIYGPSGVPIEQVNPDGTTYWLHHDQLGSTRLLTDTNGNNAATYTYDPYGAQTAKTGNATTPLGYAGQYTDTDTGLIYLRARYYDPSTGQFLSRDPAVTQTRSAYGYAQATPLNGTDPAGLSTCGAPDGPLDYLGSMVDCVAKAGNATASGIDSAYTTARLAEDYLAAHTGLSVLLCVGVCIGISATNGHLNLEYGLGPIAGATLSANVFSAPQPPTCGDGTKTSNLWGLGTFAYSTSGNGSSIGAGPGFLLGNTDIYSVAVG
jgi:RHS repeat-associated protein